MPDMRRYQKSWSVRAPSSSHYWNGFISFLKSNEWVLNVNLTKDTLTIWAIKSRTAHTIVYLLERPGLDLADSSPHDSDGLRI